MQSTLIKEIKSNVGGGKVTAGDTVEEMQYLHVYVVKARDLPAKDITGDIDPYVEIRLASCNAITQHIEKNSNPVWNQVFLFSKDDHIQSSVLEVTVKDKDFVEDDFVGWVSFDLSEIPSSIPRDVSLAPQWYRLKGRRGDRAEGELMLAVWMGSAQFSDTFPEASSSQPRAVNVADDFVNTRPKVYFSPRLWYLRVNVIEAHDLLPNDQSRPLEVYVKAIVGYQVVRTRVSANKSTNPMWNEDLMFVVPEPFEEILILSVEDKDEVLGRCAIPLQYVDRRMDHRPVKSKWHNLEKVAVEREKKEIKISSRIRVRICLEGGYHVLDEPTHYSSDLRPSAKQLQKSNIGILELGILSARDLLPMKKRRPSTTDAYCVAKYGEKWVRTKTVTDSLAPEWNEQYSWEVFDPNTVITIGVFDNCNLQSPQVGYRSSALAKDSKIGKIRIRLSTLDTDRVYACFYPLLVLLPSGVKKMGEIQLTVRFTCSSLLNIMRMYSQPLLPKMHHLQPLTVSQTDILRHQATQIVSMSLSRAEPPVRKEVVEYMLDVGSSMWSMRKSKANFFRIMSVLSELIWILRWFDGICNWKNPITTVVIHILFLILVVYPRNTLAVISLYIPLCVAYNYRWRPWHPPVNTLISLDNVHPDELDEEFDTFPTSRPADIVRMRYDRLRSIAGRLQTVAGDLATQGERLVGLMRWRDPRATVLFLILYSVAGIVVYFTPFQVVATLSGLFVLRHPVFRRKLPSAPANFIRRLPSRTDEML
ncbi:PREDICTED: FT-interacting protein 1-like [Ipomoea nil]|uniref:FT-interacting protein 1-like n=1 Tax=Ipomoea nil TaxID=35883 RepID=UPI000901A495|nr:PREDICTED: FT-interacting protein 1-like [Ipomoea nil]XP_019165632.1 PREDICTED: FT-interacting protein 1-like [Ipomoea nil]